MWVSSPTGYVFAEAMKVDEIFEKDQRQQAVTYYGQKSFWCLDVWWWKK